MESVLYGVYVVEALIMNLGKVGLLN
eukprot:CCRYP_012752-RA/>CCRYP_012752-RA protein AED:0.44 eAED:1.00 QI:0/-1/0/1/-1/0/1/0/25